MPRETPTVEEIDEALWWARLSLPRDDQWWAWVDRRLDERLALRSAECSPDPTAPPPPFRP